MNTQNAQPCKCQPKLEAVSNTPANVFNVCGDRHPQRPPDSLRVDTSQLYRTSADLPERFEKSYLFDGYGWQQNVCMNPLYRTTNQTYGWLTPSAHTVPTNYHPRTNEFSDLLARTGMYRNYSLNTAMDARYI